MIKNMQNELLDFCMTKAKMTLNMKGRFGELHPEAF